MVPQRARSAHSHRQIDALLLARDADVVEKKGKLGRRDFLEATSPLVASQFPHFVRYAQTEVGK